MTRVLHRYKCIVACFEKDTKSVYREKEYAIFLKDKKRKRYAKPNP
jgi:hypothetical protein